MVGENKSWAMAQEAQPLATQPKHWETLRVGVLPHGLLLVFASKIAHFYTLTWYWAIQCVDGGWGKCGPLGAKFFFPVFLTVCRMH